MDVKNSMEYLADKYATTMHDLQGKKTKVKESLVDLVGMLKATGADMDGLKEFKSILGGKADEK